MHNPKLPNMQTVLLPTVSLIGSLNYCTMFTRPYISFAINKCTQFTLRPSLEHWATAVHVLHYLIHVRGCPLFCSKAISEFFQLRPQTPLAPFGTLWTPTTFQFQKCFGIFPTPSPFQQSPSLPCAPSTPVL